jgi:general secretion pathway protein L
MRDLLVERWRTGYGWWIAGLRLALPARLREILLPIRDRILVEERGDAWGIRYLRGAGAQVLTEEEVARTDRLKQAGIPEWLARIDGSADAEVILVLPEHAVMRKPLTWPLSTERALRDILKLELDRQTPFSTASAYFDYVIRGRDRDRKKLRFDLCVLARTTAAPALELLRTWGLAPTRISTTGLLDQGVNLLPATERAVALSRGDGVTRALMVAAIVSFLAMLYVPPLLHADALAELERALDTRRTEALAVRALVDERDRLKRRVEFLHDRREARIPAVEILREVTELLPDGTWLDKLTLQDATLEVQGESGSATALIERLSDSPYFERVQFRAPVTRNNKAESDRFHLAATLRRGQSS